MPKRPIHPFWHQREAFRRSVHCLSSLLSSLHPRPAALVFDLLVASSIIPVVADLDLPNYMQHTSSAKMLSLFAYLPSNADVVERSGLGLWVKSWGWIGEEVVKADEIAERIKEMMGSEQLRLQAKRVGEEARKAVGAGGSCENALKLLIREWKNN